MNYNNSEFLASYGLSRQLPDSDRPEIVFSGRSNVGKSSLINKLCNRKKLARVSATPGKTATINFYRVDTAYFVDLPGYGYAKVSNADRERWDDLINSYFEAPRHHTLLVQLIDCRHAPSADDVQMMALIMTMKNKPQAVMMSFQKEYAERYDWLVTLFKDWAFTFMSSFLYYQDFDMLDDMQKQLYRQGMATFGGIAPTYHIELLERPTIVWDFHSLLLGVQMMFSFMLTDEKSSLKVCKHCGKAFVASRPHSVFCSGKCKNRYNVYKSRAKDKDNTN